MDAGWSDIGSWSSLWDISEKDSDGNSTHGDVILHNTHNSYVKTDERLVTAIGVNDLVIVSTKDVLMVTHKDSVQDVKIVTENLKACSRKEWNINEEVFDLGVNIFLLIVEIVIKLNVLRLSQGLN